MLRITRVTTEDGTALLRLEGQVAGPWVDELRRACRGVIGENGHGPALVLDLANVSFIGTDGVALFRELAIRRISFVNRSPFVLEQLKEVCNADG